MEVQECVNALKHRAKIKNTKFSLPLEMAKWQIQQMLRDLNHHFTVGPNVTPFACSSKDP